jgi:septal ring factor EnvC (AmiA/AmiB activator)
MVRLKKIEKKRTHGFLLNKGRLPGPVQGELVTRFGDKTDNGPCHGIIIHTEENTPVFSVYSGRVIFTGYKMGFGNMVIIDHGLDYYTVTAYLDEIDVEEGQRVLGRKQIGTTGDMATLYSRGLYFEIRHGNKPLDPLQWLYPNSYPKFIPLPLPGLDQADTLNWPTRADKAN